eukprot:9481725-Pyramimonas_sp.AAC.1
MIRNKVLPDPFGPSSVLLSNRLVVSVRQTFFRWMICRIHAAAQTIAMGPDPWGSFEDRVPGRAPHRAPKSAVGKIFASTDKTRFSGALVPVPVCADDLTFIIPLNFIKRIQVTDVMPASYWEVYTGELVHGHHS